MTTRLPQPPPPRGPKGGIGASVISDRLIDLTRSVPDPAVDLRLPELTSDEWAAVGKDPSKVITRILRQLQLDNLQELPASVLSLSQGFAAQKAPDETLNARLGEVFATLFSGDGADRAVQYSEHLDRAAEDQLASPELKQTKAAIDESALLFIALQSWYEALPPSVDLRAAWFAARDQKNSAGCVGFAVADLLWRQRVARLEIPSARFLWQGAKEMDGENRPTTMIAGAGTSLRAALSLAKEYGFALEAELPSKSNALYAGGADAFYEGIKDRRIRDFVDLGGDVKNWLAWLGSGRPFVCALTAGREFLRTMGRDSVIPAEDPNAADRFSHAVLVLGYRLDDSEASETGRIQSLVRSLEKGGDKANSQKRADFPLQYLIRNSSGPSWGDEGHAWIDHLTFLHQATEFYGVVTSADDRTRLIK